WLVRLDGTEIEPRPSAEVGLLEIDLPAGEHNLELTLGPTPMQATGRTISVIALVALLGSLLLLRRPVSSGQRPAQPFEPKLLLLAALVGVGVLAAKTLVFDQ